MLKKHPQLFLKRSEWRLNKLTKLAWLLKLVRLSFIRKGLLHLKYCARFVDLVLNNESSLPVLGIDVRHTSIC